MNNPCQSTRAAGLRAGTLMLALAGAFGVASVQAQRAPSGPNVRAGTPVVVAGGDAEVAGSGFKPGQKIVLSANGRTLAAQPYAVDAEGKFKGRLGIPADAALGSFPVMVTAEGSDESFPPLRVKVSRVVPLSGQERFETAGNKLASGLYQSAYGAGSGAVFVTSTGAGLLKIDPQTLQVVASATPPQVPVDPQAPAAPRRGGNGPAVFTVFGVGTDDANGTVWVTNSGQNTVAVYRQSDLSLVKQFPAGTVPHARDVAVDSRHGRAYVSSIGENVVAVFDTGTLEQLPNIEIPTQVEGGKFAVTSLDVDDDSGKVYTVSLRTPEAAVIDGISGKVDRLIALQGADNGIGVAYAADSGRLLVASASADELLVLDAASGKLLHEVYVGAGALNVAYEPVSKLAFVSSRAVGTVTVVDADGRIVANLDNGSNPNHVQEDGKGNVFAINKSAGAEDPTGDRITRITPRK